MPKFVSLKKVRRGSYNMDVDEHAVIHEGYLERKTGVMKTYRKMWFQLCGNELKNYKTSPQWEPSEPKGKMNVVDIQTVKAMSTQNRHLIQIITQKGTVCLAGESAACCEEWVTHLRTAMQRARQSTQQVAAPDPMPQKGRSVRRPAMSTVSEEEEKHSSGANAGLEYELLGTPESSPAPLSRLSNDSFVYEEVQPVKRQSPPTGGNGQTPTPDSDTDTASGNSVNVESEKRNSASSGYDSNEAVPTDEGVDEDLSNLSYDLHVPVLPHPPLTRDDSSSINQLRKLLSEMDVKATEEDEMYMNTSGNGMQDLKQFIATTFFVSF